MIQLPFHRSGPACGRSPKERMGVHKVAALADEGELALKQHAVEQCPRRLLTSASGTSPDSHGSGSTLSLIHISEPTRPY